MDRENVVACHPLDFLDLRNYDPRAVWGATLRAMGTDATSLAHETLATTHRKRQAGWLVEARSRKASGDHRGARMVLRHAAYEAGQKRLHRAALADHRAALAVATKVLIGEIA